MSIKNWARYDANENLGVGQVYELVNEANVALKYLEDRGEKFELFHRHALAHTAKLFSLADSFSVTPPNCPSLRTAWRMFYSNGPLTKKSVGELIFSVLAALPYIESRGAPFATVMDDAKYTLDCLQGLKLAFK